MCTLTVVPCGPGALRLAFNRDEQRTRAPGAPPQLRRSGSRSAVWPTDPASGGTWLAVNDAGLVLAVLNVNPTHPPGARRRMQSRGAIVPMLLGEESPAAVLAVVDRALDFPLFAPFRLVLVGQGVVADVRWDGYEPMTMSRLVGGAPRMFTSSGLGDARVEDVRRELFEELFAGAPETWDAAQVAFHCHRWPGREHLSVNMSREDARTVSHSVIDVSPTDVAFRYLADAPDAPGERVTVHLPLVGGAR
ncbi:MAG TPA: NRDE family protein [Gemmata sp.]